jgi:cytochrome P450
VRAEYHEAVLNLVAHPLMWGMARLARRVGPVWRVPGLGLMVSDAECARDILRRDEDFTKNGPGSFASTMTAALGPRALGNMDGTDHHKLRAALSGVLTPARASLLVRRRTTDLELMCSQLSQGKEIDLAYFIRGWSGRIAFDLVGIEPPAGRVEESCQEIVRLSDRMASVLGFRQISQRKARLALADCGRLAAYFREGYQHPAPHFSLANRMQELGMTFEQAVGLMLIYVIGGTLTISAALPRIVALLVDKGQFSLLAQDPAAIPRAIDEGLRFVTPLPGTVRIARRDTEVKGHSLSAGSRLVILTCNLSRDTKIYPDPDRFDITRVPHPRAGQPWYGAGPHRCAGIHLAQSELKAILGALAGIGGNFQIVKRRAAVGALLPAYARLVIRSADSPC